MTIANTQQTLSGSALHEPNDSFVPAFGLKNPHAQTLWGPLLRRKPNLSRWRERITLKDGDFIDLDWAGTTRGPIVMILHGLSGSSESIYALGLQCALSKQGIRSFAMNFRGCSGEPNKLPRLYHSGDTADADEVLNIMKTRYPNTPIAVVGYSLGGNVLLKWLGEAGAEQNSSKFAAAVAVSVPFKLSVSSARMNLGLSKYYRNHMLNALKQGITEKKLRYQREKSHSHHQTLEILGNTSQHVTFRDFDEHVVAPLHGFESADDYYEKSSSFSYLKQITTQTLIIHSLDDPITLPEAVPTSSDVSNSISLEISEHGGHVGFVAGQLNRPIYWLEQRIPEFLGPYLKG